MKKTIMLTKFKQNSGFILPVALILLLVSTLLGVTALRVNALSERMTVNALQREEAFARAEAALLEGELLVRDNAVAIRDAIINQALSNTCAVPFQNQTGICSPASHPQGGGVPSTEERWETVFFNTANPTNVRTTQDNSARYIIEFMGHIIGADDNGNNDSRCSVIVSTWPYCESDPFQFRITAVGQGGLIGDTNQREENAGLVMLQSVYVAGALPIVP